MPARCPQDIGYRGVKHVKLASCAPGRPLGRAVTAVPRPSPLRGVSTSALPVAHIPAVLPAARGGAGFAVGAPTPPARRQSKACRRLPANACRHPLCALGGAARPLAGRIGACAPRPRLTPRPRGITAVRRGFSLLSPAAVR